jgi:hypothetical protein
MMILSSREPKKLLMVITPFGSFGPKETLSERRVVDEVLKCWARCMHRLILMKMQNLRAGTRSMLGSRRYLKWSKPPMGVLKLNCDASLLPGSMSSSWGFLVRD